MKIQCHCIYCKNHPRWDDQELIDEDEYSDVNCFDLVSNFFERYKSDKDNFYFSDCWIVNEYETEAECVCDGYVVNASCGNAEVEYK